MAALMLSDLADLATILGVIGALVSAVVAWRSWRHRTGHWLYIPAPNVLNQDPAKPEFWVFPPEELEDGTYAVVIAGALINAGPSDAFSVGVYAESELDWASGVDLLEETAKWVAHRKNAPEDWRNIASAFIDSYQRKESFVPVVSVGERLDFVVISQLKRGDSYLEELLSGPVKGQVEITRHWTSPDKKQIHGVHARSRTILGRSLHFQPSDLCSPFEPGHGRSVWSEIFRRGNRR